MTVKELIEELKKVPEDSIVILQGDPEGNWYRRLRGVDPNCVYKEEDRQVYSTEWSASDSCMSEEDWKTFKKEKPACVTLHPEDY